MTRAVYMSRKQTRQHRSRTGQAKACIAVAVTILAFLGMILLGDGHKMTGPIWAALGLCLALLGLALLYLRSAGNVAARALESIEGEH